MPSPVGHVLAGVAAGWLIAGTPRGRAWSDFGWREAALFGALGALPDVDLLFRAHSGPTHSLGASLIVGIVASIAATRGVLPSRWMIRTVACVAAYASHVLLDWLGTDASPPIGIMALWPLSHAYYESSRHVFMAVSRRYYLGWPFAFHNLLALVRELVILVPILGAVMLARVRRTVSRP